MLPRRAAHAPEQDLAVLGAATPYKRGVRARGVSASAAAVHSGVFDPGPLLRGKVSGLVLNVGERLASAQFTVFRSDSPITRTSGSQSQRTAI